MLNISNTKTRGNVSKHCLFPQTATTNSQDLGTRDYIIMSTSRTKSELVNLNISSSCALVKFLADVIKSLIKIAYRKKSLFRLIIGCSLC